MREVDAFYLDEAERTQPIGAFAPKIRQARPRPAPQVPRSALPAVSGSLSLLLPGAGQMLVGETCQCVFFTTATAFLASLIWAIVTTIERLVPTLELLSVPPELVVIGLGVAFAVGCLLHIGAALQAHVLGNLGVEAIVPHPVLAGLASLIVPGWGQILAGHRPRAAVFLGSVWALAAAWIAVTPTGQHVLSVSGVSTPARIRSEWGPFVLVSISAVVWVLAVYDAVAGAHAERLRWKR